MSPASSCALLDEAPKDAVHTCGKQGQEENLCHQKPLDSRACRPCHTPSFQALTSCALCVADKKGGGDCARGEKETRALLGRRRLCAVLLALASAS
jgi:hypothetical protein